VEPKLGAFWGFFSAEELRRGQLLGNFSFKKEQTASITAAMGGATFGAMTLVLQGHRSWREAGGDTAELMMRSIGVAPSEALALSQTEFDPLPRIMYFDMA